MISTREINDIRCNVLTDDITASVREKARVALSLVDDYIDLMSENLVSDKKYNQFFAQVQALRASLAAADNGDDIETFEAFLAIDEELRKNLLEVESYLCQYTSTPLEEPICSAQTSEAASALKLVEKRIGGDLPDLREAIAGIDSVLKDFCSNQEFAQVLVMEKINHRLALYIDAIPKPDAVPLVAVAACSSAVSVIVMAALLTVNHYTGGFNKLSGWCASNLRFFKQSHAHSEVASDDEKNNLIELSRMHHP